MRRRHWLMGLVTSVTTARCASGQHRSKPARVAILWFTNPNTSAPYFDALRLGLRDLGWVENTDVTFEQRWAYGQIDRLPALAKETVASSPEVIWATDTAMAVQCKQATDKIPIVFGGSSDPVGAGLVQSLSRPGGNVTGLFNPLVDLGPKLVELLHSMVPGLSSVAVMRSPLNPAVMAAGTESLQAAAGSLKLSLLQVFATTAPEIDRAFARMKQERIDGLVVAAGAEYLPHRQQIGELLIQHRIACGVNWREMLAMGFLVSYGHNVVRRVRQGATYVDKILKGVKPADLPVEAPMHLELVVNRQTANALGITIPTSVLLRADEVIE